MIYNPDHSLDDIAAILDKAVNGKGNKAHVAVAQQELSLLRLYVTGLRLDVMRLNGDYKMGKPVDGFGTPRREDQGGAVSGRWTANEASPPTVEEVFKTNTPRVSEPMDPRWADKTFAFTADVAHIIGQLQSMVRDTQEARWAVYKTGESMTGRVRQQIEDVRDKNTALEVTNRDLKAKLDDARQRVEKLLDERGKAVHNNRLAERLGSVRKAFAIQSSNGNWNANDYMLGMFNGMEFAMAVLENRNVEYRTLPKSVELANKASKDYKAGMQDGKDEAELERVSRAVKAAEKEGELRRTITQLEKALADTRVQISELGTKLLRNTELEAMLNGAQMRIDELLKEADKEHPWAMLVRMLQYNKLLVSHNYEGEHSRVMDFTPTHIDWPSLSDTPYIVGRNNTSNMRHSFKPSDIDTWSVAE